MSEKTFVIEDIASEDGKRFAVVEHHHNTVGHSKMLKVWGWCSTEDEARAMAHSFNHPRN